MPSRQWSYQKRMLSQGRCRTCGKPLNGLSRVFCVAHRNQQKLIQRRSRERRAVA